TVWLQDEVQRCPARPASQRALRAHLRGTPPPRAGLAPAAVAEPAGPADCAASGTPSVAALAAGVPGYPHPAVLVARVRELEARLARVEEEAAASQAHAAAHQEAAVSAAQRLAMQVSKERELEARLAGAMIGGTSGVLRAAQATSASLASSATRLGRCLHPRGGSHAGGASAGGSPRASTTALAPAGVD
ncbi:unnamed protein product, partial [Prorocentrum cordatum]